MVLLAFSGVMYCAISYVAQAGWGTHILRVPQAFMSVVPYAAILLVIVLVAGLGSHGLYNHWVLPALSDPQSPEFDPVLAGKTSSTNVTFFMMREASFILVLGFLVWRLRH